MQRTGKIEGGGRGGEPACVGARGRRERVDEWERVEVEGRKEEVWCED